jgi:hypothetical protein
MMLANRKRRVHEQLPKAAPSHSAKIRSVRCRNGSTGPALRGFFVGGSFRDRRRAWLRPSRSRKSANAPMAPLRASAASGATGHGLCPNAAGSRKSRTGTIRRYSSASTARTSRFPSPRWAQAPHGREEAVDAPGAAGVAGRRRKGLACHPVIAFHPPISTNGQTGSPALP